MSYPRRNSLQPETKASFLARGERLVGLAMINLGGVALLGGGAKLFESMTSGDRWDTVQGTLLVAYSEVVIVSGLFARYDAKNGDDEITTD